MMISCASDDAKDIKLKISLKPDVWTNISLLALGDLPP
jgi:hypothetical protein